MMLMTPVTALAPQIVPPGPRITSIRSTSSSSNSVLEGPVDAGKERGIKASAVHHHKHGLGELVGKSANADCPVVVVNSTYLYAWNQPQDFRNTGSPGAANVFVG